MRYYRYLYMGESLERKKDKILSRLSGKKLQSEIFLIVLPGESDHQLEILNSNLLLQKYYPWKDDLVVGIAKGFDEALEILEEIVQEVYNETKGAEIRSYILKKEQEE